MADDRVVLAHIGRPRGVKGWLYLRCYSRDPRHFLQYGECRIRLAQHESLVSIEQIVSVSGRWAALLTGCRDRTAAEGFRGGEISVSAAQLPPLPDGRYYWYQLIGCRVCNTDNVYLGTVQHLLENSREDMMVVEREGRRCLIPFARERVVRSIDISARLIEVDWGEDWS